MSRGSLRVLFLSPPLLENYKIYIREIFVRLAMRPFVLAARRF